MTVNGDVLKYDSKSKYQIVLNVHATYVTTENSGKYWASHPIFDKPYNEKKNKDWDPYLYDKSPVLIGEIKVTLDGKEVM
ncbi:hypothetical protein ANCCAN_05236 [Ancylostoma caninum]|uniref:Uncharacterized protein n=1 Tax=Ancylostoma caninum TaxID=29170 RepID=A0A368GYF5_ANCCA|nr:hypothetical protein ANCCAN_05236 [Ancylostoma caninum]